MKRLFLALLILFVSASATAAQPTQNDIARLLPGTWALITEINGTRLDAVSTYRPDGQAEERVKVTQGDRTTEILTRGSWRLEGDVVVTTYAESNSPELAAVGSSTRVKVTFIDDKQLSVVDEEGTALTGHRVGSGL